MKTKELKYWNGRFTLNSYKGQLRISIAAYSKAEAGRILKQAYGGAACNEYNEITKYFNPCWGNDMNNISTDEPCAYVSSPSYMLNIPPTMIYPINRFNHK